jgi:MYXO-CTERM domain-containing protein
VDADGDSVFCHEDCDDANAAISPLAEEVPEDGLDNDCQDGDAAGEPSGEDDGDGAADGAAGGDEAGAPVEPIGGAKKSGCACTQGGGAPVGGLALMGGLLALGLRRRRA